MSSARKLCLFISNFHLDIAHTLFNIENILDDKGDQDEKKTLKFYIEALAKLHKRNFEDDNEDVANCNENIGLIHMRRCESINTLKKNTVILIYVLYMYVLECR